MQINFYATLRPIVGGKSIEFPEAAGLTVQQTVEVLIARYPGLKAELLAPDGTLHGHVHFFINGRDYQFLTEGMSYVIQPADTINIFPAVGGGAK
jgi:molybdopterin synthase sulfur carrier subunit